MTHPIVSDEQVLLRGVRTLLEEEPYEIPPREADIVAELVRLREEMPCTRGDDLGTLMEQYNRNHALLEQIRESRSRPAVDPDSPYFAHLRLSDARGQRDIFLGKATRIARGIRIVDWRNAPISKLFYAYQQGEEYEEELGGRTQIGELVARRTLTILRGRLERIDAPEGTFATDPDAPDEWHHTRVEPPRLAGGQGTALRTHAAGQGTVRRLGTDLEGNRRRRDKRLPDIAGLIDPDQFELITQPSSGFVVIRGTAGSGKTTVALHRIAYLAYDDPGIDSPRTLFIVFSEALREYVSHVLPALGVHKAQIRDFRAWALQQRRAHFPKLPKVLREDSPEVVVRLKLHPVLLTVLREQVDRVNGRAVPEQALDDVISSVTDLSLLRRVFARHAPDAFNEAELVKATTWCRDRFEEIVRYVEGDREVDAALDAEDEALLLYAHQLRVGPLRFRNGGPIRYRHVAIDEVQDFSPIDVRVLTGCLDKQRSITLAGDTQQHVMKDAGFTSWAEFFSHLGLEGTAVNTLRIAYRSSKQIVDFSLGVLGPLREDDVPPLVTREGPPVELFRFTDHGASVAFLADALTALLRDEPLASVALLTPSPDLSATYYAGLRRSEVPKVHRVLHQDFTFAPGIEITEIAAVKGLEFDYVVIVEASARHYPDTASARRLLHVAATRAVHQLWVTSVDAPSSVLGEVLR